MNFVADLHIHSKYSRACSKDLDIAHMEKWARIKGLNLLGTGDFTHPKWIQELKSNLTETEKDSGFFQTASGFKFVLQTEISLIYTQERGRKVHNVVLAPSFQAVDEITQALLKRGRIDYDGRPIFKISCPEFVEMMKSIDNRIQVIPAHAWTPWFGVFGANGGFDSLKECFQDQMKNVHAIETGISSDPPMNWRIKELDNINIVSFSDIHSFWPWRLGREATVFDIEPTFDSLAKALETGKGLTQTIEVNPNLGKYHLTGHRVCNVCLFPDEAKKLNNVCPECGKPLTVGVDQRIEELANRPLGYKPENAKPFSSLIPLSELLAQFHSKAVASKKIWEEYNKLVTEKTTEFDILLNMPITKIAEKTSQEFADILAKNRAGNIEVKGGYDGVYGVPLLTEQDIAENKKQEVTIKKQQKGLGEFF
jgi:uncharacterized protein (TIGR00375 family)